MVVGRTFVALLNGEVLDFGLQFTPNVLENGGRNLKALQSHSVHVAQSYFDDVIGRLSIIGLKVIFYRIEFVA